LNWVVVVVTTMSGSETTELEEKLSDEQLEKFLEANEDVTASTGPVTEPDQTYPGDQYDDPFGIEDDNSSGNSGSDTNDGQSDDPELASGSDSVDPTTETEGNTSSRAQSDKQPSTTTRQSTQTDSLVESDSTASEPSQRRDPENIPRDERTAMEDYLARNDDVGVENDMDPGGQENLDDPGNVVQLENGRIVSEDRFRTLQMGVEQVQEANPDTEIDDVSDVSVGSNDDGTRVIETSTQFEMEQYADAVEEQTDADVNVDADDVLRETSGDGLTLAPAAQDRVLLEETRANAAEQFDRKFENVDITEEDVVTTEDGATLNLDTQRQIAAMSLSEQTETDVSVEDVRFGGQDDGFVLTEQAQRNEPRSQSVTSSVGVEPGDVGPMEDVRNPGTAPYNPPEMPQNVSLPTGLQSRGQVTDAGSTDLDTSRLNRQETDRVREQYPDLTTEVERQLEDELNVELERDDLSIARRDGRIVGQLSEVGQESVEVQRTPGANVPVIGGILTTGTRIRQDIRDTTDPVAESFRQTTPNKSDVLGFVGAAAPFAATEPTPGGEVVLGTLAAAGLTAAALNERGGVITGDYPTAETSVGIGSGIANSEIESPDEPTNDVVELPTETTQERTEISVPEEETTVTPEELGIPREPVQDGNVEITGPGGTEITDDGDIVIPAGTKQATGQFRRSEDEDADDADSRNDVGEETEENEVVVNVPDEFIPDEQQTLGEVEEPEDADESPDEEEVAEQQDDLLSELGQRQAVGDAQSDGTQVDEKLGQRQSDGSNLNVDVGQPSFGTISDNAPSTADVAPTISPLIGTAGRDEQLTEGLLGIESAQQRQQPDVRDGQQPGQRSRPTTAVDVASVMSGLLEDTGQPQRQSLDLTTVQTPALQDGIQSQPTQLLQPRQAQQPVQRQKLLQDEVAEPTESAIQYQRGFGNASSTRPRFRLSGGLGAMFASDSSPTGGRSAEFDSTFESGWYNEFVVATATGGDARSTPDQEILEERPIEEQITGQLPTEAELTGSEQTQDRIEDVVGFFRGEGVGVNIADEDQQKPGEDEFFAFGFGEEPDDDDDSFFGIGGGLF